MSDRISPDSCLIRKDPWRIQNVWFLEDLKLVENATPQMTSVKLELNLFRIQITNGTNISVMGPAIMISSCVWGRFIRSVSVLFPQTFSRVANFL